MYMYLTISRYTGTFISCLIYTDIIPLSISQYCRCAFMCFVSFRLQKVARLSTPSSAYRSSGGRYRGRGGRHKPSGASWRPASVVFPESEKAKPGFTN